MKQLELSTSSVDHTLGYAIVQVMFSQQLIMVVSLFYSYFLAHMMCNIALGKSVNIWEIVVTIIIWTDQIHI